jgi:cytochrome c oxidase assembly protein subunit 15
MKEQTVQPSPVLPSTAMRRVALAAVISNVVIVITGGAVRLTGSGLGCPQWPTCTAGRVLPAAGAEANWHQAIEFGNRGLAFVVLSVAVAALVVARRQQPRRDDIVRAAAVLVAGVVTQAVLGGITVLAALNPLIVAGHFLLSMTVIAVAVALNHRVRRPPGRARVAIRRELRHAQHVLLVVVAGVLVLGTLVTASGPHAGDPNTPRLGLDPELISRFHADGVFLLLGLIVALWFALRATDAPPASRRAATTLLGVALAQGIIGYVQYFTGLPEIVVGAHLLGACLVWLTAVHLWLSSTVTETAGDPDVQDARPQLRGRASVDASDGDLRRDVASR